MTDEPEPQEEEAAEAPAEAPEPERAQESPEEPEPPSEPSEREREAVARLLASSVARNADVLADGADLLAFAEESSLLDAEGWPDEIKIRAAAEQLAAAKPHLAARRFVDVGQGARKASPPEVSLSEILRLSAG